MEETRAAPGSPAQCSTWNILRACVTGSPPSNCSTWNILGPARIFALYALLFAAFFSPALGGARILAPNDGLYMFAPAFQSARDLWTTRLFSGYPVAADPNEFFWYPPARILAWLPAPVGYDAFVIAGYALAAAAAHGLVLSLTRARGAALVAGVGFGACGFLLARVRHPTVVHAAAWGMVLLLVLDRMRASRSLAWVAAGAAATALLALGGHPQFLAYGLAIAAAYALAVGRSAAAPAAYFGRAAAAVALGLALAAPLVLPAQELAAASVRADLSFADFVNYELPPRQLPALVFPYLFGGLATPYAGALSFTELAGYVGLLPLVLAGLAVTLRARRVEVRFFAGLALLSVLLALGDATPLAALLYRTPVLERFRCPGRHLVELAMAASVLAGIGLAALAEEPEERRRRLAARASLAAAAAALAALLAGLSQPVAFRAATAAAVLIPLGALALGLAALRLFARSPRALGLAAVVAAVALDLGAFGWFCEWRRWEATLADLTAPPALATLAAETSREHARLAPLEGAAMPLEGAPANRSRLWGIESVSGYGALVLERYRALLDLGVGRDSAPGAIPRERLAPADRTLDVLAVRAVLAPEGTIPRPRALPRAWLASEVRALAPAAILRALRGSRFDDGAPFDPSRTALVETEALARALPAPASATAVAVEEPSETELVLRYRSPVDAFLVDSDVFYPGWEAILDGATPLEIVETDHALRGVYVPAGDHVVRLAFRPWRVRAGLAIAGVAAALCLGLLLVRRRSAA